MVPPKVQGWPWDGVPEIQGGASKEKGQSRDWGQHPNIQGKRPNTQDVPSIPGDRAPGPGDRALLTRAKTLSSPQRRGDRTPVIWGHGPDDPDEQGQCPKGLGTDPKGLGTDPSDPRAAPQQPGDKAEWERGPRAPQKGPKEQWTRP